MQPPISKPLQISALLLATACAHGTGPTYAQNDTPHLKNKARVVVYRPGTWSGGLRSPEIDINGQAVCDMTDDTYFAKDIEPKPFNLTTSLWDFPGTSRIAVNPVKGKTYYIRISYNEDKTAAQGLGGIIGLGIAEGVSSKSGPLSLDLIDEQMARSELQNMHRNTQCN